MDTKLNPPIVENKSIAQKDRNYISIPFMMNKSVGWGDFDFIILVLKTVQSNVTLETMYCSKESLILKNGRYWGSFPVLKANLMVGQHYKAQLAYGVGSIAGSHSQGFFSNATTFKFTSAPVLSIQNLHLDRANIHFYDYSGVYLNSDTSEKVYSYTFNLYDSSNRLVATSGEKLHNSSLDTDTNYSIDQWTTRYSLEENKEYLLSYSVTTVNGLKCSSPTYRLVDNQTIPSSLFQYSDFVATNVMDSACVELSLRPSASAKPENRKFINGQFILLRSSNEDKFHSWQELTRFALTSYDTSTIKVLCRDYCVAQGITYKYALQAYNNSGMFSTREESKSILIDFEDMFLSDGERQLKIRFNPSVSSFKNVILESKMDTLGGKYPFFFRNGNVLYKEFPIGGLISMIADDNEEFMSGVKIDQNFRSTTPASRLDERDLPTALTGDNFRREREFKLEVLKWLANGKPKLFRSPGEGNYIVRLMNAQLSPTDTISRMLHSFSCTAYEIADYTFENLRKYGMMMDEYLEIRNLNFHNLKLSTQPKGSATNLNAQLATLRTAPGTELRFKLQNDTDTYQSLIVGATGVYVFSDKVLADNPLMEISPPAREAQVGSYWHPDTTLTYATYADYHIDNFSQIDSIQIVDRIVQWNGLNRPEIPYHFDEHQIRQTLGMVYYLNISKRPIMKVDSATPIGSTYKFYIGNVEYHPGDNELLYYNNRYYDGKNKTLIGRTLDFTLQLRSYENPLDFKGTDLERPEGFEGTELDIETSIGSIVGCDSVTDVGGRIVLTNARDIDYLYIGNGLYVDIAYQEVNTTYTIETVEGHPIKVAKDKWLASGSLADYNDYYNKLYRYLTTEQGGSIIDAL